MVRGKKAREEVGNKKNHHPCAVTHTFLCSPSPTHRERGGGGPWYRKVERGVRQREVPRKRKMRSSSGGSERDDDDAVWYAVRGSAQRRCGRAAQRRVNRNPGNGSTRAQAELVWQVESGGRVDAVRRQVRRRGNKRPGVAVQAGGTHHHGITSARAVGVHARQVVNNRNWGGTKRSGIQCVRTNNMLIVRNSPTARAARAVRGGSTNEYV